MTKQTTTETSPTAAVQDYVAYTADEILRGILAFAERSGWTDPANLGHWLGAIQRWAKGEPLSPSPEIRELLHRYHHVHCHSYRPGGACTCWEQKEKLIAQLAQREAVK